MINIIQGYCGKNDIIPIYCKANFKVGSVQSVYYENNGLMNCKILNKHELFPSIYNNYCSQWYNVEVLEYPAQKVIHD